MSPERRRWLLYALAWLPAVLLDTGVVVAQGQARLWQALLSAIVVMGAAALGGVGVWWLTGRLPVPPTGRARFIAAQVALAVVYSAGWLGVFAGWIWLVVPGAEWRIVVAMAGPWHFVSGLWLYGVIAGISYFIRAQARLREREVAAARAEAAAAQAQLQSIRARLNPHFLYNALHSVAALVRGHPRQAEAAVERLGSLLRYALDEGGEELVRLAQEWAFTQSYLELERLRLGDRLKVQVALDPAAQECCIPPFLVQPLVENAVRHGVAARPEGGSVGVQAEVRDGTLAIQIEDDGPGADPIVVSTAAGLGIGSVRRLLQGRYDGRARLTIDTAPGRGFRVTLALPSNLGSDGA